MNKLIGLIYPFTKSKLRRALHFALAIVTVAGVVSVLLSSLGGWQKAQSVGLVLAAFVANAKIAISKAEAGVNALPIPEDDSSPTVPPVVCLLALGSLLLASSCSSAKPTPAEGMRIAVQCAHTACDSTPPGPCERLIASAISCLVSAGNTAVCLGGVPALVQVGYADLVCVVDALAIAHDDKAIRESALKWVRGQNVDVIR